MKFWYLLLSFCALHSAVSWTVMPHCWHSKSYWGGTGSRKCGAPKCWVPNSFIHKCINLDKVLLPKIHACIFIHTVIKAIAVVEMPAQTRVEACGVRVRVLVMYYRCISKEYTSSFSFKKKPWDEEIVFTCIAFPLTPKISRWKSRVFKRSKILFSPLIIQTRITSK